MQYFTFTLALLATLAAAEFHFPTHKNILQRRQGGDAFVPSTTTVDSCQTGWVECGTNECILPSRGDVCCSEGYGCPGGSFCLTQGFCCPDGEDPATCAQNNGVSIPPDFNTAPAVVASAPASAPPSASGTASASVSGVPTPLTASSAVGAASSVIIIDTSTTVAPSYSSYVSIAGTGTINYTTTPSLSTAPQFTGAAVKVQDGFISFVGGVAGAVVLGLL